MSQRVESPAFPASVGICYPLLRMWLAQGVPRPLGLPSGETVWEAATARKYKKRQKIRELPWPTFPCEASRVVRAGRRLSCI